MTWSCDGSIRRLSWSFKIIAAEGEMNASKSLKQAADIIGSQPAALQLRYFIAHFSCWKLLLIHHLKVHFFRKLQKISFWFLKFYLVLWYYYSYIRVFGTKVSRTTSNLQKDRKSRTSPNRKSRLLFGFFCLNFL